MDTHSLSPVTKIAVVAAGVLSAGALTVALSGGAGPAGASRTPGVAPAVAPGGAPAAEAVALAPGRRGAPTAPTASADGSGITLSGVGRVLGTPDTVRLSLGVSTTASDVSDALGRANASITKVTAALRDRGVKAEDIQTSGLSVGQDWSAKGEPSGYRVEEQMSVVLRELAKAGSAVGAAVEAGGNTVRVNGLGVDLDDSSALVAKAREAAFGDARRKAETYAKLAGRTLGPLTSLSESSSTPVPMADAYAVGATAGAAPSADVPVSAGQSEVSVTVTATWALA